MHTPQLYAHEFKRTRAPDAQILKIVHGGQVDFGSFLRFSV